MNKYVLIGLKRNHNIIICLRLLFKFIFEKFINMLKRNYVSLNICGVFLLLLMLLWFLIFLL